MAAGATGFSVLGCADPTVRGVIAGAFVPCFENHGRPVFKKTVKVQGCDVLAYFWDERDGPTMCGWWFGPQVGADNVFAFSPSRAQVPPERGWQVPFQGPIDPQLVLRYHQQTKLAPNMKRPGGVSTNGPPQKQLRPAGQLVAPFSAASGKMVAPPSAMPGSGKVVAPPSSQPGSGSMVGLHSSQPGCGRKVCPPLFQPGAGKMLAPQSSNDSGRSALRIRSAARKLQSANADTLDKLEEELKVVLFEELPKCGTVEKQAELNSEITAIVQKTKKNLDAIKTAQEASRLAARLTLDCEVRDASSRSWLAGRLVRLENAYDVQAVLGPEVIRVRPRSNVKLSDEAVDEIRAVTQAAVGEAVDVGTNELEAPAEREPDAEDAALALSSLDFQYAIQVRVLPLQVKQKEGSGRDAFEALVKKVKDIQRNDSGKQQWVEFVTEAGKAKHDPGAYDIPFLQKFLRVLGGNHLKEEGEVPEVIPLRVVGPRDAARDAAALLWARYVLGQKTAGILQVPEQVQRMSKMMVGDFQSDVAALESEYSVEVHQTSTMLWIAGKNAENVTKAKRMLQEMLEFYMPESFHLRKGLSKEQVDALHKDPGMICRTCMDPEGGSPACMVALDSRAGTVWLSAGKASGLSEAKEYLDSVPKKSAATT